jgi:hypothetical protein
MWLLLCAAEAHRCALVPELDCITAKLRHMYRSAQALSGNVHTLGAVLQPVWAVSRSVDAVLCCAERVCL